MINNLRNILATENLTPFEKIISHKIIDAEKNHDKEKLEELCLSYYSYFRNARNNTLNYSANLEYAISEIRREIY